jgi:nucleoid DNA-binding protein
MAKKAAPKPAPAAKPAGAAPAGDKPASSKVKGLTKADVFAELAEKTTLTKKQIAGVFDGLSELITKELGKKGPGLITVPGLLKLKRVTKPATKAKQGINPFTKEPMLIKAKPARNVIKAYPLKALKETV